MNVCMYLIITMCVSLRAFVSIIVMRIYSNNIINRFFFQLSSLIFNFLVILGFPAYRDLILH